MFLNFLKLRCIVFMTIIFEYKLECYYSLGITILASKIYIASKFFMCLVSDGYSFKLF